MQSTINYPVLNRLTNGLQKSYPKSQGPVEEYLTWKETHSKTAFKAYRIWVNRFQDFVGRVPEEIELSNVTMFMRMIQHTYSPKNVEYGMNIIYNYLRFWKEQGKLSLPLYLIRVPTAMANSHNAITEEEHQRMLAVIPDHGILNLRNRCIIQLLHDTGMRVGELCALDVGDIEEETTVIKTEKTTRRRRVFWTTETDQILREYLKARSEIKNRVSVTNALFFGLSRNESERITSRSIQRMVKEMAKLAKIDRAISPHSFRHGFIHRLAKKGVPDAVIAYLVGHSTPLTIAHYTKLSRPEIKDAYQLSFGKTITREEGMGLQVQTLITA